MRKCRIGVACILCALVFTGCSWKLLEVRGKTKFGPEFRDKSGRKSEVRWTSIQQGFEFKWDNGWKTEITYRRRDTDEGSGGNDNAIWLDFSYPLWKAPKGADASQDQIESLEKRLAQLEAELGVHSEENRVADRHGK